ncbi:DUF6500 family protein, partial [Terasakiella sp.]|uniref:DUF6500 family protein n=1 Tax=Terasakiella sp. TaxID=2034861 RepID=UPI003AA92ECC
CPRSSTNRPLTRFEEGPPAKCRGPFLWGLIMDQAGGMMRQELREKIINICTRKINEKGSSVGVSFYAFFANKNDDPEALMEAATWWIETHQLNHFEKAQKIKEMIEQEL